MPNNTLRKRRTREHVIADLAVNYVERLILMCGHTMHRVVHDYGLDATIRTYSPKGEVESGAVWLQIKATDHVQWLRSKQSIRMRSHRKDLLSWIREPNPVVLVVYDAKKDRAYWLHIQHEMEGGRLFELARKGASVTLQIPMSQTLDLKSVRYFREVDVRLVTGVVQCLSA